jgi:hypothetical protein
MAKKKIDLEFVPFETLNRMSLEKQVKFIIKKAKQNKILIFDSKLSPEQEAKLITETMKHVSKRFSGVEICTLKTNPEDFLGKARNAIFKVLTGKERGTSIIGPAKIIKKIKRNPKSISMLMK